MASRASAVDQVIGQLFERKQRVISGAAFRAGKGVRSARDMSSAARRPCVQRMSRVGARDGAAVFKLIRSGGTTSREGLRGQMNYIFNDEKLAGVLDSSGRLSDDRQVDPAAMNKVIRSWSQSWWNSTRNGNTSHMILSFPATASIQQVRDTAHDVLEDLLGQPGRAFDYVAAIHDDREHHPHVHVIVNRRRDDNTLFTLRSGSDLSYERFREAMAEHGLRHGLDLDPTFRFERGIRDRQPSYAEQLAAQAENRAPEQRPRFGADLAYQEQLIDYAQIAYEAMAVIAINADNARLSRAYADLSQNLLNDGVNIDMPVLNDDQIEKFEKTKELFEEALKSTQQELETRDAAGRAAAERELDEIMRDFTQLSKEARYAKDLHSAPDISSIYMHGPGARPDAIRGAKAQNVLARLERDYGLSVAALTARLETGASSRNLEKTWVVDDLNRVAARDEIDIGTQQGREQALDALNDAYAVIRKELVAMQAIRHLPHLDTDFEHPVLTSDGQLATPDDVLAYYRNNGAPEDWIAENREAIVQNATRVTKEYVSRMSSETYAKTLSETDRRAYAALDAQFQRMDFNYGYSDDPDARERGRQQTEAASASFRAFAETSPLHAAIASDAWDRATDIMDGPQGYVDLDDRLAVFKDKTMELRAAARVAPVAKPDPFAKYAKRSPEAESLTHTDAERAELMRLVRENTTEQERALLGTGNPDGARRLTDDDTFARQITSAYEVEMRRNREVITPEARQRFAQNERVLGERFSRGEDFGLGLDD